MLLSAVPFVALMLQALSHPAIFRVRRWEMGMWQWRWCLGFRVKDPII